MKLSSILSMFVLLTMCTASLLGNEEEDFYTKYGQPTYASGSQEDYIKLFDTGACYNCNLKMFDLRKVAEKYKGYRGFNLSHSDCYGANLSGVNLCQADLSQGNFERANFEGAKFSGCDADGANFSGAYMNKTIMPDANFYGAIFRRTNLEKANLKRANFTDAYMDYTNMKRTNIKNALFHNTYLKETNFRGAKVNKNTSFAGADCISTNFRDIDLDKADFYNAILHRCKMSSPISNKMRTEAASIVGTLLKCCSKKDILGCKSPYIEIK